MKNVHAVALGQMAKGVPKNFSAEELALRKNRMVEINKRKFPGNSKDRRKARRKAGRK